jgi:hypothetical protein
MHAHNNVQADTYILDHPLGRTDHVPILQLVLREINLWQLGVVAARLDGGDGVGLLRAGRGHCMYLFAQLRGAILGGEK